MINTTVNITIESISELNAELRHSQMMSRKLDPLLIPPPSPCHIKMTLTSNSILSVTQLNTPLPSPVLALCCLFHQFLSLNYFGTLANPLEGNDRSLRNFCNCGTT